MEITYPFSRQGDEEEGDEGTDYEVNLNKGPQNNFAIREGPRPTQAILLGTLWVAAALLAMERVVGLEGRVGAVDRVVRVGS